MKNTIILDDEAQHLLHKASFRLEVKKRSDKLMNYFLAAYFLLGLVFASFYDTWFIAFAIGGISLIAYYSVKLILPYSNLYQYVLSGVLGMFMAQYIYQMHGLFEMHFVAFIGSALLITYQNWKLQIPLTLLVVIHHGVFGYMQNAGFEVYFTKLDYFDVTTFVIHILLAAVIFFICGLWAYQLKKYNEIRITNIVEMGKLQKEAALSEERKQSEEILRRANEELTKSNKELDKFVYSVSHDLRAPLTSMLGLIEISEEDLEDPFLKTNLEMLKTSIGKLDGFIQDILDYSRNARQEVATEKIDFKTMLDEIMDNLKYMNGSNRLVKMQVDIDEDKHFVSDKRRLNIVMNNLLSNAIRYQNPKVSEPCVDVKVDTNGKEISIMVKDNGVGIKKELHSRIFDMFYRVSQQSEGSGLGLYIVKETVEKLNGRIEINSELGMGTAFNIYIPNLDLQAV